MESDPYVYTIFFTVVITAWIGAGVFMIYSAITGKGIKEPDKSEPGGIYFQYKIRGLIGAVFLISGIYILFKIMGG